MPHLLIVGGSDAGIRAALRAREVNPAFDVTVVVADRYPNYSICGLPFWLVGEVAAWRELAHRTAAELEAQGLHLLLEHTAQAIHPTDKAVTVVDDGGQLRRIVYDRLVIGTGAVPARPPIQGLDQPGVFFLRTMGDGFALQHVLDTHSPTSAIVVGAGHIRLEMADALVHRGMQVTLVEYLPSVLATLDRSLGRVVGQELEQHGVAVRMGVAAEAIARRGQQLVVAGSGGLNVEADVVLVATGVRPEAGLAAAAGIQTGQKGAIVLNQAMETNVPHVCAVGGQARFAGLLGTQVVKVFDVVAARTGLRDAEASQAGFHPRTVPVETWDHTAYYPGGHTLGFIGNSDVSGECKGSPCPSSGARQPRGSRDADCASHKPSPSASRRNSAYDYGIRRAQYDRLSPRQCCALRECAQWR